MNLLLAARKIWQHKLVTLPIIALILAGAFYVVAVKSPVYEATSSFILVNPPEPPSLDEIDRDPSLLDVNSDNPYTRYSDQSVVAQVLASRLSSDAARKQLETRGADPGYTVAPSVEFGFTAPVVNVTGTGPTPAAAVRTAEVLNAAARKELLRMQDIQKVDPEYRIDTQQVVVPQEAQLKASGKLRMLVVVFALGAILLFIAITLIDAIKALRGERPPFDPGRRYLPPGPTPNGGAPALPERASGGGAPGAPAGEARSHPLDSRQPCSAAGEQRARERRERARERRGTAAGRDDRRADHERQRHLARQRQRGERGGRERGRRSHRQAAGPDRRNRPPPLAGGAPDGQ